MPIISINNLSKTYQNKQVFEDISLEITEGQIYGIIGMTGSGKTTLFHMLLGQEKPSKGTILIEDKKVDSNHTKMITGYSTQDPSFYPHLTVRENITYFGELYNISKKELTSRVKDMIALVNLQDDAQTLSKNLSGGMQKRLDIACSLIHNPKIVLLDEPTSDLDPVMRKRIWDLLKQIKAQGKTIVLTSHYLDEIEHLCDSLAIIHNKKIIRKGTVEEVEDVFKGDQEIILRTKSEKYDSLIDEFRKENLVIDKITQENGELIIRTKKTSHVLKKAIRIVDNHEDEIVSFDVRSPKLHEVFEELTKEDVA